MNPADGDGRHKTRQYRKHGQLTHLPQWRSFDLTKGQRGFLQRMVPRSAVVSQLPACGPSWTLSVGEVKFKKTQLVKHTHRRITPFSFHVSVGRRWSTKRILNCWKSGKVRLRRFVWFVCLHGDVSQCYGSWSELVRSVHCEGWFARPVGEASAVVPSSRCVLAHICLKTRTENPRRDNGKPMGRWQAEVWLTDDEVRRVFWCIRNIMKVVRLSVNALNSSCLDSATCASEISNSRCGIYSFLQRASHVKGFVTWILKHILLVCRLQLSDVIRWAAVFEGLTPSEGE